MKKITSNAKPTSSGAANPSGQPKKQTTAKIEGATSKAKTLRGASSGDSIHLGFKPSDLVT